MRKPVLALLFAVLLVPAVTESADWIARLRAISISPNDSSSTILDTGTAVTVDSKATVEVDITMMLSDTWGLELIAATAAHDLATSGGDLGGVSAGEVSVLPPTLTLQYFFATDSGLHPYAGVGVNFTLFYDYELSDALAGVGATDVDFDNSFGLAGDLGLDIDLGEKWLLNFDLKYIMIDTDATIKVAGGGSLDTVQVDIDPWVYGIGIGLRF
jgi:outer membrane protein